MLGVVRRTRTEAVAPRAKNYALRISALPMFVPLEQWAVLRDLAICPAAACGQNRSSTRRLQFVANLTFVGFTVDSGKVIWMRHFSAVEVSV